MVFWIYVSFLSSCDSLDAVEWYNNAALSCITLFVYVFFVEHSLLYVLFYIRIHVNTQSQNKTIPARIVAIVLIVFFDFLLSLRALILSSIISHIFTADWSFHNLIASFGHHFFILHLNVM